MTNIAFLGLGHMGLPMAINLHKAGHSIAGFDVGSKCGKKPIGKLSFGNVIENDCRVVGKVSWDSGVSVSNEIFDGKAFVIKDLP